MYTFSVSVSLKKDIMYIEFINLPTTQNCNGENQPNCHLHKDRTINLRITNILLLSKTSSNKSSLIALNVAICMMFYLIHPTITNNIHRMMKRNQRPSVIGTQSLNFILYSIVPNLISVSIRNALSSKVGGETGLADEIEEAIRLVVFGSHG